MFFDEPIILHSCRDDGRHWLTTVDMPPLQIWPLAPKHCRVGYFLTKVIAKRLADTEDFLPEITLTRNDVAAVNSLSADYPETPDEGRDVLIKLVLRSGPDTSHEDNADETQFITPMPPESWTQSYDLWITFIGRTLGIAAPEPVEDTSAYDAEMEMASIELQNRLPNLRQRFIAGMDGLNLGFKIALTTNSDQKEYVWVRPIEWNDTNELTCILESQPYNCEGYSFGQTLKLTPNELVDYAIGSESAGLIDLGLTQRIAENYGLAES